MLEGVRLWVNMSELDGSVLLQMAHQHSHLRLHKARPHQEDVLGHTLRHDHYVVSACCKCEVGGDGGWGGVVGWKCSVLDAYQNTISLSWALGTYSTYVGYGLPHL